MVNWGDQRETFEGAGYLRWGDISHTRTPREGMERPEEIETVGTAFMPESNKSNEFRGGKLIRRKGDG